VLFTLFLLYDDQRGPCPSVTVNGYAGFGFFCMSSHDWTGFFLLSFFLAGIHGLFSCLRGEDKYYIFSCLMLFFLPLSWSCDDLPPPPPAADRRKRSINGLIESIKNVP